ncbi:MAG TPA: RnfH family protein [Xanthomonadaceae bacterium]|nr:RnfH family protein [Xanthomonadaceae bacterium]
MPPDSAQARPIRVEVVYALPDRAWSIELELPAGAIASEAVLRSGFAMQVPNFDAAGLSYAIFGKTITATTVLRDGDRLELLRPLVADPKQARRLRAKRGD